MRAGSACTNVTAEVAEERRLAAHGRDGERTLVEGGKFKINHCTEMSMSACYCQLYDFERLISSPNVFVVRLCIPRALSVVLALAHISG